jgi:hypothetical protein
LLPHPHKKKQKMPQNNSERIIPTLEEAKQIWSELGLMPKLRQDGPIEQAFMAAKAAQMKTEPCDPSWRWGCNTIEHDGHGVTTSKQPIQPHKVWLCPGIRSMPRPDGWGSTGDIGKALGISEQFVCSLVGRRSNLMLIAPYRRQLGWLSIYFVEAVNALDVLRLSGLQGGERKDLWEEIRPPLPV